MSATVSSAPFPAVPRLRRWGRWGLLLVLASVPVWLAGWWAERHETDQRLAALHSAQELHALGLRGVIGKYSYLPAVVGRQPAVRALLAAPDDAALRERVNEDLAEIGRRADALAVYVMDPAGNALAASNAGTPESFVGRNYARRPYFTRALQGGTGLFYGVGLTTGAPGLFIAEPVRQQGGVRGVVAVKVGLEELSQAWAKASAPVLLQDSRGIVFLSSEPDWLYRSSRPLSADDLAWLARHEQYGPPQTQAYPALPWRLERTADQAEYRLSTRQAGRQLGQLALLAMGFLHPQQKGLLQELDVELDERGNVRATEKAFKTNIAKVFTAGDMRRPHPGRILYYLAHLLVIVRRGGHSGNQASTA